MGAVGPFRLDSLTRRIPSLAAGLTPSALRGGPPISVSPRLGAADPRLSDRVWMERMYAEHGDMWIALETGAARGTVRARRESLGIETAAPGRRRGMTTSVKVSTVKPAAMSIASRIGEQSRPGRAPGSKELVAERIRALHEADADGNPTVIDDAIIEAAAALGLWLDRRRRLRAA